ncbi:monovalent cation/H+ antiporter complex subunit F [Pseudobdellovibrio exovorus]|uniref:Cation:proton antiporter n=1 Tax=Pseudobdellovibrio exovorus JSS TaxID=1184267 RepID=M4V8Q0_9BACT|nr:monovalent cation/H+ antiporter complex subunit F [Pseudobdellovibrio exovorus]AGH94391.1 hypothetical protein A11Q_171 [Pseudobdellovibrio exovorus JSS]
MLNAVFVIAFVVMMMALLFAIIRLWQGPSTVDRIVIFDLFASIAIGLMAIAFLWLDTSIMLDVGLLLSVVAFVGTIGFARYTESREAE